MINVLIVEDNLHYVKNILNSVINKFKDIHISHIATTVKEAIEIVTNNYIDLIFLDLKLPDANGIKVIEELKKINGIKQPNIVIISAEMNLINEVRNSYKNLNIISKLSSSKFIYKEIKRIVYEIDYIENKENIEKKITTELMKIGYDFKYKGTLYIFEAIDYIYRSNNLDLLCNLEKNVYKYIAYKYHKSINNIKTNIIKATNLAYLYQDNEVIKKYFSLDVKPTPKMIITTVLMKCNNENNNRISEINSHNHTWLF